MCSGGPGVVSLDRTAGGPPALRVSPVNPYQRIVTGLTNLLSRGPLQLEVGPPLEIDEPEGQTSVDVALYDTYGTTDLESDVRLLCGRADVDHVIVLAAETNPSMEAVVLAAGADAVVSKLQPSTDLFASIIAAGNRRWNGDR